jgi:type I restriction enzyme M protein
LSFEDQLWQAAVRLRGKVEEARYKDLVLGLIFLKFVSESFSHRREQVIQEVSDPSSELFLLDEDLREAAVEDHDYYGMENVPWVPQTARWDFLMQNAKQPNIGQLVDDAMTVIELANPRLRGVLPKVYGRYPQQLVGPLIDLFTEVETRSADGESEDVLGRVYEFFLNRFGANEGGQYYTPQQIVKLLVEVLQPFRGRVYDPCCGSGGMFVQSVEFVARRGGWIDNVRVFGQEAVEETWRLAKMNLAIRKIDADLGDTWADTFANDKHPDLRADFVIANPPFNQRDWSANASLDSHAWPFGTPPDGNGNYAWIQLFLQHLAPGGRAGFVLARGSLDTRENGQGLIRRRLVDADLVECIVNLPDKLFATTKRGTGIPVCLWFLARDRAVRRREVLFVDASRMGTLAGRRLRLLTPEDVEKIASTVERWRHGTDYEDEPGFCQSASLDEIVAQDYVLIPGRYIEPLSAPTDLELAELSADQLRSWAESQLIDEPDLYDDVLSALEVLV